MGVSTFISKVGVGVAGSLVKPVSRLGQVDAGMKG